MFDHAIVHVDSGTRHEPDTLRGPERVLGVVQVAPIQHNHAVRGQIQETRDRDIADFAVRQVRERWEIALVVEQEMKLDCAFGPHVPRPVKQRQAQLDGRRVERVERVLEPKRLPPASRQTARCQQLIKDGLVQLPWPMLIGVGQGRALGRSTQAEVLEFSRARGQPAADLPEGLGLRQLAEEHRDELVPARESLGGVLGFVVADRARKFKTRYEI